MIEYVKWDSDHFGMKIGKWIPDSSCLSSEYILAVNEAKRQGYDLLYLKGYELPANLLSSDVVLADQKIVYSQLMGRDRDETNDANVVSILHTELRTDVLCLALQSGAFSRYYRDKRIPLHVFLSLYKAWIENSINGDIATDVLAYTNNGKIIGLLTFKLEGDVAEIGLLDVDYTVVGQGIGTKLMQAFLATLPEGTIVEVATQKDNNRACAFYEKNGFHPKSITKIYHIWINK